MCFALFLTFALKMCLIRFDLLDAACSRRSEEIISVREVGGAQKGMNGGMKNSFNEDRKAPVPEKFHSRERSPLSKPDRSSHYSF